MSNITTPGPYTGCLRNLIINGKQHLDFTEPLMQEGLSNNCWYTDRNCYRNPCGNDTGQCIGSWEGYYCICKPDYTGGNCLEGKQLN